MRETPIARLVSYLHAMVGMELPLQPARDLRRGPLECELLRDPPSELRMARQATRLRAQCPLPGTRLSFACAVGAAATVAPYLSTDSRGRSPEPLCDLPHRLTGRNTTRNLFAFIAPQRYPSSAAWRWRNSSVES